MTATSSHSHTNRIAGYWEPVEGRTPAKNVSETERLLSAVGGGALTLYGLSRGSVGGLLLAGVGGALLYRGLSGHCSLYAALGVSSAKRRGPATSIPAGGGVRADRSITIRRSRVDLFHYWRNLENLPRFISHLKEVRLTGPKRSHWVACGPLGADVEWDAEVITERENELIGWRSLPGSEVDTAGSVHFLPIAGGTEVRVEMKYDPPAGKAGAAVARLFGDAPEQQLGDDLRRFKDLMEGRQAGQASIAGVGRPS